MKIVNVYTRMTTGLPGLDKALNTVRPGDNIVFQVASVNDYSPFVIPFCASANKEKKKLIYFRFAEHACLLPQSISARVVTLHPENGFESFIDDIFDVIEKSGAGACYVFDCLSELAVDWYSDRMLGNFFMLTCPYLYDWETAAYFSLLKNVHSAHAIDAIHGTAQVVIDVFRDKNRLYIQPKKVYKRHSETMYTLHRWEENGNFIPIRYSAVISEVLGSVTHPWLDFSVHHPDIWSRTFTSAQEMAEKGLSGKKPSRNAHRLFNRLIRMAVTRDPQILALAEHYFTFADLIEIGKRMIGTGLIGGKSAGMLLARAILQKKDPRWRERMGAHDSFYIGSDVFYTYLIRNGCWWVRRRLKNHESLIDTAQEARQRLLSGTFPDDIVAQFTALLNYFGQSPIIIRSSSLLEDAYGNSFSGKYESVFCANQGTPEERLENFMSAVRTVYASTMNQDALSYRAHRGLLDKDEQMALLVQRVSGASNHGLFFPQVAGVGFSFNPYVWSPDIDPRAGVLRLVFGLGTRAVNRSDDDYTRIVSLNAPERQPGGAAEDRFRFSQRKVDVLDLRENRLLSMGLREVLDHTGKDLPVDLLCSRDEAAEQRAAGMLLGSYSSWAVTFEKLIEETSFVDDMRGMLAILETAYNHPVDIEFTANFLTDRKLRINLVQCRPFQVRTSGALQKDIGEIEDDRTLFKTSGPIIGCSISSPVERIIYVVHSAYSDLTQQQQYQVARIIGTLARLNGRNKVETLALIGPGRWGTTTPSLGVPVSFAEISNVKVLIELSLMREGLVPDVSLGTHFFNDLVEMDMLYMAIYPDRSGTIFKQEFFETSPSTLSTLLPEASSWERVIRVIDASAQGLFLHADPLHQNGICFRN
ncbi:MAG: PEP/pyruvate-binding domain-containing protein [Chitinispirillaceae bacterium]|nr:PEP/pyruvate-binding domain-containing protein [Chitinispirillaceae bacterium]